MKTKYNKILLLFFLATFSLTSCEKFLDMQETEEMTFEKIWQNRGFTERYLWTVYSYMTTTSDQAGQTSGVSSGNVVIGAADESSCSWTTSNYPFSFLNKGAWNVTSPAGQKAPSYYQAVREANIFMQNIDRCSAPDVTAEEKAAWKTEARFLRAYYYGELLRFYGPVMMLGDLVIPGDASLGDLAVPRSTWDECVEWVCSEMEEVAKTLPSRYTQSNYYGKPTNVAALCYIARLRMISARDLFNGNQLYAGILNPDGTRLFPTYDANKWVVAAQAGRKAIDAIEANGYGLYVSPNGVYQSLKGIFYEKWNNEMIYSRYISSNIWANHTRPRAFSGGYGGHGPTQQQVDAYAMKNGIYPIVGYNGDSYFLNQSGPNGIIGRATGGEPTIDPDSGYTEKTFSSWANPAPGGGAARPQWDMYKNREPRFYSHLSWNDTPYFQSPNTVIQYHSGANTGNQHHDHPWTGYMVRKMGNESTNASSPSWSMFNWPMIRVAEVYLNYAETLVESDLSNPDILKYVNLIRSRAGVPNIGSGAGEIYGTRTGNQAQMRELVRAERRIELAFEGHRYFDTREWMIAETTDNGAFWGMNLKATNSALVFGESSFWKRTIIQERVFKKNHYLYPFNQRELDRNKNLTQNYGW